MKRYTKDDVEQRYEGYEWYPAVNVKIYKGFDSVKLPLELGSSYPTGHPELIEHHVSHAGFNHYWIEQHVSDDDKQAYWNMACEDGFEQADELVHEMFDEYNIHVYQDGRSGGWLVVHGLPPVDGWDAVALAKWRKFEKQCKAIAADVPRAAVESIYMNIYEQEAVV